MTKQGNRPAGGIGSRVVTKQPVRTGAAAREMDPRGVSQIGSSMGNHSMDNSKKLTKSVEPVRGAPMSSVALGNQTALSAGQGPGSGRTVSRSGSQAQHGAPEGRPAPQGRDILSEFGPESKPRGDQ